MGEWLSVNVANTSTCGTWTLEALNWDSGASEFHVELGDDYRFNPFYAATEIGPDGDIYAGTLGGFVHIYYPKNHVLEIIAFVVACIVAAFFIGVCGYKCCMVLGCAALCWCCIRKRNSEDDDVTDDDPDSDSA